MADAERDGNFVPTLIAVSNADGETPVRVYADPTTHRLLVDLAGGSGTVTSVSVVTANGFAGSVADPTTTPAITLSTTVTGIVKGNGTALSAAVAGTDYVAPGAITTSGLTQATARLLGRTTAGTGAVEEITVGSGLSFAAGSLSATGVAGSIVVGTTTITSGTDTRILYDNAGVLGEYTLTGTGTVVAMQTAPTFVTSITTPSVLATANDSGALGAAGTAFSDLFLAEGGVINWDNGDATLTQAGDVLTLAGADLKVSSPGNASTSVLTTDGAQTVTAKRNQPRTASSTSNANLDPDLSTANVYYRTTQTTGLTIGAPTGTPVIGETIAIYVDSAGAQTLTINSTYKAFGSAFPASTTAGKTFMMVAQYNGTDWKTTWANAV
jgi:hypothetical protein